MWRHVAVQNLAAFVLDDKEAVQHSERHRRYGEKIECRDPLTMILEKREPLLRRKYRATVRSAMVKPSFCSSA
jgi:hypothetical protein